MVRACALSKRLAEILGGSVGVESELGQGSIFYAKLPIHFTPGEAPQAVVETARGARLKDV